VEPLPVETVLELAAAVVAGREPFLAPRRRGASVRTIPLAQITRDVVAAHLAAHPPLDGFVFVNDDGRPIRRSAFGSVWRTAVAAAGTPAGTGFHELRHF
jgi:integrase